MHLNSTHSYISGDVTIADDVAIAPGVIIRADANSRIVIKASVCIGMGSVLHACGGILEIENGTTLGSGVLLIGPLKIGPNVSIGSGTTIIRYSVPANQVIKSGSLLGSSEPELKPSPEPNPQIVEPPTFQPVADQKPTPSKPTNNTAGIPLYGKDQIKDLLGTLFPYRDEKS